MIQRLTFAVFPGSCAGIYCSPKLEEVFPSHRFHQGLPKTLVYKQLSAEISALRIKAMAAYPEPGAPWCEPLFTPEKWQKSSSGFYSNMQKPKGIRSTGGNFFGEW